MPVQAQVHNQQRGQRKSDYADSGEDVAEVAPIARPEVEYAAGDECKRDGIGARHPLPVLGYLPVSRSDKSGGGADDPSRSLHRCSGETGSPHSQCDPGCGPDVDSDDVKAAQYAMELQVALANA